MGFGGSSGAAIASLRANAALRARRAGKEPFQRVNRQITDQDYTPLVGLSKYDNKKIREARLDTIHQEQYVRRVVGVVVTIPVLMFLYFLVKLFIDWI